MNCFKTSRNTKVQTNLSFILLNINTIINVSDESKSLEVGERFKK
jgi:hypothetical protein